jgi:hypothetical protein
LRLPDPEPVPPICDENTPPEQTCRDEGDPDDCQPGYVDRGFGCELEEPEPIPEIPFFPDEDTSASEDEDSAGEDEDEGSDTRAEEGEDDSGSGSDEEDSSSGGEDESAGKDEGSTFG